jgi:hypothetical protein
MSGSGLFQTRQKMPRRERRWQSLEVSGPVSFVPAVKELFIDRLHCAWQRRAFITSVSSLRPSPRQFRSILLLVLYLLGQLPGMALLAAAVAGADGEHSVEVCGSRDATQVVLGHAGHPVARQQHEHHGLAAMLAGPQGGDHPDHHLLFHHATATAEQDKFMCILLPPPACVEFVTVPVDFIVFAPRAESLVCAALAHARAGRIHPPECGWGTVRLLI